MFVSDGYYQAHLVVVAVSVDEEVIEEEEGVEEDLEEGAADVVVCTVVFVFSV